jgi:hypothetical protein
MYCLFCVLCIVCVYMCTELLPPGGYPIAVKYIVSYQIWQMFCLPFPLNVLNLIFVFILWPPVQLERPTLLLMSLLIYLSITHALCQHALGALFQKLEFLRWNLLDAQSCQVFCSQDQLCLLLSDKDIVPTLHYYPLWCNAVHFVTCLTKVQYIVSNPGWRETRNSLKYCTNNMNWHACSYEKICITCNCCSSWQSLWISRNNQQDATL